MLTLASPSFKQGDEIPGRHTCDGLGTSPPLSWTGIPAATKSFALIVDDPDAPDPRAPRRVWVHWIRYNIPATQHLLPEGAGNRSATAGACDARTDANALGYHGPCPPVGRHRYFFRLMALDATLPNLGTRAGRAEVEKAMRGHVLATAELMGTYQRSER